jgi:glycosyltransferase involved in cell wall biosynthesis
MKSNINFQSSSNILTIVIPVGPRLNNFDNLISNLRAVESFPVEIIIVFDCRRDESLENLVLEAVKRQDTKVVFLYGNFGNPGGTRNLGLSAVKTPWVTFWDADDIGRVDVTLNLINNAPDLIEVIAGSFIVINQASGQILTYSLPGLYPFAWLSILSNPGIWRFTFRTNSIKNSKFSNLRMGEDQNFLTSLKMEKSKTLFSKKVVYEYFVGVHGQLTSDSEAKKDLVEASEFTVHQINSSPRKFDFIRIMFFVKQCLTSIKHGNPIMRKHTYRILLEFMKGSTLGRKVILCLSFIVLTLNLFAMKF